MYVYQPFGISELFHKIPKPQTYESTPRTLHRPRKMKNPVIYLASDHAGYDLKIQILQYLHKNDYLVVDFGSGPEKSDYPDYAHQVSEKVSENPDSFGILICGTGIGMSIAANRSSGIRAAVCWNEEIALITRRHNDSNIVCLGSRTLSVDDAIDIIQTFISTPFEGGRHEQRIEKIEKVRKEAF